MNERWSQGLEEARWIVKILENYGIYEGKILDVMCGNGRHALYLAEKGYQVIGLDLSPVFIKDAIKRAEKMGVKDNVSFIIGDIRDLPHIVSKYSPFDGVINFWTSIGYYGEEVDILLFRGIREVARRDTVFIIGDTISKEYLQSNFSPTTYAEFNDLLVLHFAEYDPVRSILTDLWRFYEKKGDDWAYRTSIKVKIRVYSIGELARILKKTGWEVVESYDSIIGFTSVKFDSRINFIAKAV